MNTLSIPVVAMSSISLYVGLYHLLIYFRRRQNREDLTFSFLCFAYVFYAAFCVGLYNAVSVTEGAQWQRAQFIALAVFVTAFLWFVSDYTRQKPGTPIYLLSIFYLLAIIVQLVDRSNLTFRVDQPSVKHITLPYIQPITYYETALGPLSTIQGLMGIVASTYILMMGIRYFRRGYKREARPLILAIGLMYTAGFHDTLVSNGVYAFIYLIEYAYLAVILVMAYSLSTTVVEAAMAKEELRKSEERFRSLVEATSDWVWEVDANGVYTYSSPKVRDLLGYEPEELIGRTPFDLMPPEETERVSAIFQMVVLNRRPLERVENIARHKDGQLVVLETSGVPFFDGHGKLLGYRGIDRDVTERKRTEAQIERVLRETRVRFEVSQTLTGAETEDEVLDVLIQHAGLYPQAFVVVFIFDRAGGELAAILRRQDTFESGLTPSMSIGESLPASRYTLFGHFLADQPFVSEDVSADQRFEPTGRTILTQTGVASFAAIPLTVGNEWMGYIGVMAKSPGYFDQEKLHLYQTLAEQGAVALHSARLRETIRESQQRLSLLVQQSPLAVIEWDPDFRVVSWNTAAEQIFGYSAKEALGRYMADIIVSPAARPLVDQTWRALLAQRGGDNIAHENVTKAGRTITCEWFNAPLISADGQVIGVASLVQDITERKRAEEVIRNERQRFQTILETIRVPTLISRLSNGEVLYANQAIVQVSQVHLDKLIGFKTSSFYANLDDRKTVLESLQKNGHIDDFEVQFRRTDGSLYWALLSSRIFNYEGELCVLSTYTDITERKRAEQALQAKTEELDRYFTSSLDLLCIADTDGYFRRLNPEWETTLGYTIAELEGRQFLEFVHPEDVEATIATLSQLKSQQQVLNFQNRYRCKDGSYRWIEWRSYPMEKTIYAVARDITERKLHEAERESLIASLEAKNAELERFTYTVSHDLKAPLITIRGFLGFIEQDGRSGDMNRLKGDIQRISAATDKMQRLLNELLELSRIGRLMNPPEDIAFGDLIQDVIKLMEERLRETNVEIKVQDDLPVVRGDSQRLFEVVQNLLDNAVKFMGEQPSPVIGIGTRGEDKGMPVFYVRDNGIGIAPEHHDRIFGLFNKLDPRAEGTGVGLAIVKRIVEVHGGRIWVESEQGKGATFYFTFGKGTQDSGVATATSGKA